MSEEPSSKTAALEQEVSTIIENFGLEKTKRVFQRFIEDDTDEGPPVPRAKKPTTAVTVGSSRKNIDKERVKSSLLASLDAFEIMTEVQRENAVRYLRGMVQNCQDAIDQYQPHGATATLVPTQAALAALSMLSQPEDQVLDALSEHFQEERLVEQAVADVFAHENNLVNVSAVLSIKVRATQLKLGKYLSALSTEITSL